MFRPGVRYIQQQSTEECGAACLAMVLDYYGHSIPLSEARDLCGAGRDGTSLLVLKDVAGDLGMVCNGFHMPPTELRNLPVPAILHWERNHFVVLESASEKGATVVDPALGRRKVDNETLRQSYSGTVLIPEPGHTFERRRREPLWRNYLHLVLIERRLWIMTLVFSVLLTLYGIAIPFASGDVTNRVVNSRNFALLEMALWAVAAVFLSYTAFSFMRARLLVQLQIALDSYIMQRFVRHLLTLPYSFFQGRPVGDLVMRANTNSRIRDFVSASAVSVMLDSVLVVFFLALIFWQSLVFASAVVTLVLIEVAMVAGTWNRLLRLAREETITEARSQSFLTETLQGVASLKVAGAENRAFDKWANAYKEQLSVVERRGKLSAYVEGTLSSLERISPLLLVAIGLQLVLTAQESIGTVLMLYVMGASVLTPVSSLLGAIQGLQVLSVNLERLHDVNEAHPEQPDDKRQHITLKGNIETTDVCFRYGHRQPEVLQHVDLSIEAGQKIAIVGPSGSGKSSLAKLLVGLYEPVQGQVLYDGVELADVERGALRRQIGVVLQEAFVFGGTIRENISLHDPAMPLERIVRAASLAAIHKEIISMPLGYDTLLSEGAGNLSGGQRQRLAIARALAHEPAVLLLDEATSDLDTLNEREIDDNLGRLECTRVVIAHRLSTVKNADRIVVLEGGRVADQGTHRELLSRSALYRNLVAPQAQHYSMHADVTPS